jgi:hypothetical protein
MAAASGQLHVGGRAPAGQALQLSSGNVCRMAPACHEIRQQVDAVLDTINPERSSPLNGETPLL